MENIRPKTIMLSGGGTGGSVTPLLAIASELLKEGADLDFVFVGAKIGPEKKLVGDFVDKKIKFLAISSGKLRRYLSVLNLFDFFKILVGFFESLSILSREQPRLVLSAGSFVSVPLVWAAAIKKIPVLIHQQDIRPGLANKLMAPFARVVTVTFEKSLADYGPRAVLTGNPLKDITEYTSQGAQTRKQYGFKVDAPLILIIGGGTGALAINNLVAEALPGLLSFCQIIHLTGQGKRPIELIKNDNYQVFEFLPQNEVLRLMVAADLIISRCGLGALTELAALGKAAILIPIPKSHQEDNAVLFKTREASIVLNQDDLSADKLKAEIQRVLSDARLRGSLEHNIRKIMKPAAAQNIAAIIWEIIGRP